MGTNRIPFEDAAVRIGGANTVFTLAAIGIEIIAAPATAGLTAVATVQRVAVLAFQRARQIPTIGTAERVTCANATFASAPGTTRYPARFATRRRNAPDATALATTLVQRTFTARIAIQTTLIDIGAGIADPTFHATCTALAILAMTAGTERSVGNGLCKTFAAALFARTRLALVGGRAIDAGVAIGSA